MVGPVRLAGQKDWQLMIEEVPIHELEGGEALFNMLRLLASLFMLGRQCFAWSCRPFLSCLRTNVSQYLSTLLHFTKDTSICPLRCTCILCEDSGAQVYGWPEMQLKLSACDSVPMQLTREHSDHSGLGLGSGNLRVKVMVRIRGGTFLLLMMRT